MTNDADRRPVLFLDVDGVLNTAVPPSKSSKSDWLDWKSDFVFNHEEGLAFPFAWSGEVVESLNALSERVEILWLTTWDEAAATAVAPALGLKRGWLNARLLTDVELGPNNSNSSHWFKADVIISLITNDKHALTGRYVGRPVIWIDDDAKRKSTGRRDVEQLAEAPLLTLAPQSHLGVTAEHLARIDNFIADNA